MARSSWQAFKELMDPGEPSSYYPQTYPGYPGAPEFDWMEAGPPGTALLGGGVGAGLANALGPAMAGTWQNLRPPQGLQSGGALSKELQGIADTVRGERGNPYAGLNKAEQKYNLEPLGAGAYKRVYRYPTQESQPLAVAVQTGRSSGTQGRDVTWPGSVKGVAPLWWYEKNMPRSDVRVFAMPEIQAGRPVPPRTPHGDLTWYGEPQMLDVAEILSKMQRRGMHIGDLHGYNVLPEYSEQAGRFRPVVVDRGAIYPDTQGAGFRAIRKLIQGDAGFGYVQGNSRVINEILNDPKSVSMWPALQEFITNNQGLMSSARPTNMTMSQQLAAAARAVGLSSLSASLHPSRWIPESSLSSGPTPSSQARPPWYTPSGSQHSPAKPMNLSSGASEPLAEELVAGQMPSIFNKLSINQRAALQQRVFNRLQEIAKENPTLALSIRDIVKGMFPLNDPSAEMIRKEGTTGGGLRDRDMVLEHAVRRQIQPSWVPQPSPFFKVTSEGPMDPWSRALRNIISSQPWESP